ncbi:mitochondrial import inner membrane translocase subunit Tim10 B [Hemicordylus capensis]|uniref:mitochondrial import inner membrane translocase subunit Tim10 B n=1 Tax=Hemicordylus capensis TaxID=884348 RepID=UPI002304C22F|nr:mitochondrial import inner membrane translocase subunit Tim10 B [Hemicordylus capensis]
MPHGGVGWFLNRGAAGPQLPPSSLDSYPHPDLAVLGRQPFSWLPTHSRDHSPTLIPAQPNTKQAEVLGVSLSAVGSWHQLQGAHGGPDPAIPHEQEPLPENPSLRYGQQASPSRSKEASSANQTQLMPKKAAAQGCCVRRTRRTAARSENPERTEAGGNSTKSAMWAGGKGMGRPSVGSAAGDPPHPSIPGSSQGGPTKAGSFSCRNEDLASPPTPKTSHSKPPPVTRTVSPPLGVQEPEASTQSRGGKSLPRRSQEEEAALQEEVLWVLHVAEQETLKAAASLGAGRRRPSFRAAQQEASGGGGLLGQALARAPPSPPPEPNLLLALWRHPCTSPFDPHLYRPRPAPQACSQHCTGLRGPVWGGIRCRPAQLSWAQSGEEGGRRLRPTASCPLGLWVQAPQLAAHLFLEPSRPPPAGRSSAGLPPPPPPPWPGARRHVPSGAEPSRSRTPPQGPGRAGGSRPRAPCRAQPPSSGGDGGGCPAQGRGLPSPSLPPPPRDPAAGAAPRTSAPREGAQAGLGEAGAAAAGGRRRRSAPDRQTGPPARPPAPPPHLLPLLLPPGPVPEAPGVGSAWPPPGTAGNDVTGRKWRARRRRRSAGSMELPQDPQQHLRSLRDFLLVYNRMTELCFQRCVSNLNYRTLTRDEEGCLDSCAGKLVRANHRLMASYVQLMPSIVQRRIADYEAAGHAAQEAGSAGAAGPGGGGGGGIVRTVAAADPLGAPEAGS